ncbi:peptidase U32 [Desulfuromonas acetoxidans DSM 684]|uniref:Peptidase U32 n=2 Tax=Desulfuromonas acetoxidans TaxID=891 RepID=Q1K222_DESA6|nr:peptidase U32 [Desulfuromonas acetoxidans DSM 684]
MSVPAEKILSTRINHMENAMNKVELLVPAGDMDKLKIALRFGADAVYVGGRQFGLRAAAGNFDLDQLRKAIDLTHQQGKRIYLTLNAYLRPEDLAGVDGYLEALRPLATDGYIVSDPGVLMRVKHIDPQREIHLSTQANTTNAESCRFWQRQGVERVNLARELNIDEIRQIRRGSDIGLEVFVHGAMCVAYSGRCLLSTALTGRSANEGACAQPCRWNYALVEETRPGQYFPIEEDGRGTYIMNSRDLCLLDHVPDLIEAGVDSLKIEGRMKTLYYVAAVTRIYRAAIDRYLADPANYQCDPLWIEELDKVSHRPYTTDYLPADDAAVHTEDSRYRRTHDFIGVVREVAGDRVLLEGRNRFSIGDTIELIGPQMRQVTFTVPPCQDEQGEPVAVIQPNARVWMTIPGTVAVGDLLRREKSQPGWTVAGSTSDPLEKKPI